MGRRLHGWRLKDGCRQGLDGREDHRHVLGQRSRHERHWPHGLDGRPPQPRTRTATISSGLASRPASIASRAPPWEGSRAVIAQPCSIASLDSSRSEGAPALPLVAAPAARNGRRRGVRARNTLVATGSALAAAAPGAMPPMGCGTVITESSGSPRAADWRGQGKEFIGATTTQATPLPPAPPRRGYSTTCTTSVGRCGQRERALLAISSRTAAVAARTSRACSTRGPRAPPPEPRAARQALQQFLRVGL